MIDLHERSAESNDSEKGLKTKRIIPMGLLIVVSLLTVLAVDSCYASEYSNYTSEKYGIQFQYLSDWNLKEKTGRFDEGSDIQISNPILVDGFAISYTPSSSIPESLSGFRTLVNEVFNSMTGYDVSDERSVIEEPTFVTIDGKQTATFLFTTKKKYDDNAIKYGDQVWMVINGDHGYLISFLAKTDSFDSPENIVIRDHFIKSIKFLDVNNQIIDNTN